MKCTTEVYPALSGDLAKRQVEGKEKGQRGSWSQLEQATSMRSPGSQVPRCYAGEAILCDGIWHASLLHGHLCWLLCCCPWAVWGAAACPQAPRRSPPLPNVADGGCSNISQERHGPPLPIPACPGPPQHPHRQTEAVCSCAVILLGILPNTGILEKENPTAHHHSCPMRASSKPYVC